MNKTIYLKNLLLLIIFVIFFTGCQSTKNGMGATGSKNQKENMQQALVGAKELNEEFKSKGVRLHADPMLDVTFISFNNQDAIFKENKKLRQAMSAAYDREQANKLFYVNTAVEAQGPIPPGIAGYRKEFKNPYTKFDLDLAKKLLKEAGYPDGKGLPTLTVETRNETMARQIMEHFAENMKAIGITVKVNQNTWPELVNKVTTKRNQMYTMAWGADYPDAENYLSVFYSKNPAPPNYTRYKNSLYDVLYEKSLAEKNDTLRYKLYQQMDKLIIEDAPIVPLWYDMAIHLVHSNIKNFPPNSLNLLELRRTKKTP